jgi:hypothetical protein
LRRDVDYRFITERFFAFLAQLQSVLSLKCMTDLGWHIQLALAVISCFQFSHGFSRQHQTQAHISQTQKL